MFKRGLLLVAVFGTLLALSQTRQDAPRVKIDAGEIEGVRSGDLSVFLGIPYAAPPTANRRWKPPELPSKWKDVRAAASFGPACPQDESAVPGMITRFAEIQLPYYKDFRLDEDCLSVNVWTRNLGGAKRLPVMVWIHGGSNISGSGAYPAFGESLTSKGVVYVSFNYRLGALGFLAHPELTAESKKRSSGNYGLLDQIAALQWVQRNIAKFGGDPHRVAVFGESAGATMICYLMASPLARGLFQRAILESCTCHDYVSPELHPRSENAGSRLQKVLQAGSLREMRARSAAEIVKVSEQDPETLNYLYLGGTVDGWVLREQPAITYATGRQMKVPVLLGSNADEGTVTLGALGEPTLANYRKWLTTKFEAHAEEVFAVYPARSDADAKAAYLAVTGDYQRGEAVRSLARDVAHSGQHAYLYYFNYPSNGEYARQGLGSFHGLDQSFVGGGFFRKSQWGEPDAEDLKLAELMSGYWTQFAAAGDPNRAGLPMWHQYDPAMDEAMQLGTEVRMIPVPHRERFVVFENILKGQLSSQLSSGPRF